MTTLNERLARYEAEDKARKADDAAWALLTSHIAAGAVLTYRGGRYWLDGVGSISERYARVLVRRHQLWRTGPIGPWPLPEIGSCPEFPAGSDALTVQTLFRMLDGAI